MLGSPRLCTAVYSTSSLGCFSKAPIVEDIKMLKGWILQIKIRWNFVLIFNDKSLL